MNDKWKNRILIGQGGNGKVYKVTRADGKEYAVKILNRVKADKAYKRFRDEIKVLKQLDDNPGIIKVIEYHLPKELSALNKAYYIMPLGIPITYYLKQKTHTQFYSIVIKLAQALELMHYKNVAHRDIKPENILVVEDEPLFSDFGLATFPKKENLSLTNEKIGPKWTIAPEMKRISSLAEYKKADVYSFAKTIWILITKEKLCFEGQYIPNSTISIDKYVDLKINDPQSIIGEWEYKSIVLLEKLLVSSTDNDPNKRPTAQEFLNQIQHWYNTSSVFHKRNAYEWEHFLERIFPMSIPEHCLWSKLKEIHDILKLVCSEYDSLNYVFYPISGGNDFTKVDFAKEEGCLIINEYLILKPKRLIFESMGDLDFSFFRLDVDQIDSIEASEDIEIREALYLTKNGRYRLERSKQEKKVYRYIGGSFIITRKTSILNKLRGNFDGHLGMHHNKSDNEYKKLVDNIIPFKTKFD